MRQTRPGTVHGQMQEEEWHPPAGRYVLNLCTSESRHSLKPATPQTLREVGADLSRFAFFMSRRVTGGRELYCLHMGYFETLAEAEQWAQAVREIYPAVWAGLEGQYEPPPNGGNAWADATGRFAAPAPLWSRPPPPAIPEERRTFARFPEPEASRTPAPPARPAPLPPPRPRPPEPRPEPAAPSFVTRWGESPPPVLRRPSASVAPIRPDLGRPRKGMVFYVVQLESSPFPLAIEDAPPLPILDQYTLYTLQGETAGEQWHALRVGFFEDLAGARQLADSLRSEVPTAKVVPVTVHEKQAATDATQESEQYVEIPVAQTTGVGEASQDYGDQEYSYETEGASMEEEEAYAPAEAPPARWSRFLGKIPLLGRFSGRFKR